MEDLELKQSAGIRNYKMRSKNKKNKGKQKLYGNKNFGGLRQVGRVLCQDEDTIESIYPKNPKTKGKYYMFGEFSGHRGQFKSQYLVDQCCKSSSNTFTEKNNQYEPEIARNHINLQFFLFNKELAWKFYIKIGKYYMFGEFSGHRGQFKSQYLVDPI